jgi:hypothetical protein
MWKGHDLSRRLFISSVGTEPSQFSFLSLSPLLSSRAIKCLGLFLPAAEGSKRAEKGKDFLEDIASSVISYDNNVHEQ